MVAFLTLSIGLNAALVLPGSEMATREMGTPASGSISSNATWTLSNSPYWIEGDVTIESGVTLTIEEGVDVLSNGFYTMYVQGNLTALASASSPVAFSSNDSSPSVEDWYGIIVGASGHLELEFVLMSFATVTLGISSPYNNISNCTISDSMIAMDMSDSLGNNITSNNVSNNEFGFFISSSPHNYIVDNTFWNNSRSNLLFFGSRVDLNQTVATNLVNGKKVHYYENLNNTTIRNLESGHITLVDSHNTTLENVTIPKGDAVSLAFSSNISVRNCSVSGGWSGVNLHSTTDSNITNCSVANTYQGVKVGYSSNVSFFDVKLANNTEGFYVVSSDRIRIVGSNISTNDEHGVRLIGSTNAVLKGNVFWNNSQNSLWVAGSLKENFNHTIDNSNLVNGKPILYLFDVSDTVVDNMSLGHATLAYCDNITLSDISMDNGDLLYFVQTINSSLIGSSISNSWVGVRLQFSDNNTVEGSRFAGNGDGILAFSSEGNVIVNNTLFNSTKGVEMYFSSNNKIFRNNFLNNMNQSIDFRDGNSWDNGYPEGGNYWSDYGGVDLFGGQNQDVTGSDGIGDSPYVIDADSQDRYPLMNPVATSIVPTIAGASLTNSSLFNVTIYWRMEEDLAFPNEVDHYDIYRNTSSYDPNGVGYQLIASVPKGTFQFVDGNVGEGDPNNYFYNVCAVDTSSNSSCSPNQAGKFTRSLGEGTQLVSIPLIQSDERTNTVFQTVSYEKAWFFDSSDVDDYWKSHVRDKPFRGDLTHIDPTMAVWVNVTGSSNLTIAGIVPTSTPISLRTGWNLIGFPSFNSSYTVADLKSVTGSSRIEGYEPLSSPYYLRELGDLETLEAGLGYWIWVDFETTWVVKSS